MKAVIMRGKKKYPAAKYIGEKISCAALLQEKNICLAQSEFSSIPPPYLKNGQLIKVT
jgi:hypothetical protein